MIVSPPLVDPYDVIKDKFLSIYDTSEDKNLNQLLHGVCLGDRLPWEMPSRMQRLVGNNVGTGLLKKLFLERLPPIVQNIIVATPCDNLTELAQCADRVYLESSRCDSSAADTSVHDSLRDDLANKVENIIKSLQELIKRNSLVFENFSSPTLDKTFQRYSCFFTPVKHQAIHIKAHPAPSITLLVQLVVIWVVVRITLIFQARQARVEVFSMNKIRVTFVSVILTLVNAPGIALRRVRGTQRTQVLQTHARLGTAVVILPALILLLASCL